MNQPNPEQVDYIIENFMPRVRPNTHAAIAGVISGRFALKDQARCHNLSHQALRKVVNRVYEIHKLIEGYP